MAKQQGVYVGRLLCRRLSGQPGEPEPFVYRDKGSLAVIGRNAAGAELGKWHFSGLVAWVLWAFVHIAFLVGFSNKFIVMFQWAVHYVTRQGNARLITARDPYPLVSNRGASKADDAVSAP